MLSESVISPRKAKEFIHERDYSIYDDLLQGVSQTPPIIQKATTKRHESDEIIFKENMVVIIQPNVISKNEKMGLQFGETVVIVKAGCQSLNEFPREGLLCQR